MAAAPASSSAASAADSREEIVFLDVETSTPPSCVLLEFGAVVVCSRRLVDVSSYATLVRPADPDAAVPDPTARCSGITRDAVAHAPPFRDVADKVYDVLHGRVWAGHNIVKFDSVIIRDAFAEIGRPPPEPKGMVDTLPLLTQWFGPRAGDMKEESLRGVLPVQNMLEGATIRTQVTSDPATSRDSNELAVGSHVEEMVLDTTTQMDARSSIGFSGFVELDDVSIESIKISVMLLQHRSGPRTILQHKGAQLHLSCADLEVRWVSSKVLPQLSIRVDIPDNLSKVLVFCDNLAQSSSPEGRSSSPWKPLIKRYGNANRPTVRLNIPTVVSGNTAMYSTQIYQKDCNGVIPKLASRKVDAANLESMLQGKKVDAFFSLEIYGYQQNAGIRLVAKRLDVHF